MAKEKLEKFTSPKGTAKYVWLKKPDVKFKKEGQFKITLVIDDDTKGAAEMKARIQKMEKAAYADAVAANKGKKDKKGKLIVVEQADSLVRPVLDDEDNIVDGKFEVQFKTTASGVNKKGESWERRVPLFDAKGTPTDANIGGGSTVKVSYSLSPYFTTQAGAGVTAYLEAVQVIDLVKFSGAEDAKGYGFGEEEGYEDEGESTEESEAAEESESESAEDTAESSDEPAEEEAPASNKKKKDF